MNLLFVCTGNTCRSPMAECIAKDEISKRGLDINVSSAGFLENGASASLNSVLACSEIGLDLSSHESKIVTKQDIDSADIIFAMTASHAEALLRRGADQKKVRVLGGGIADPYGCPLEAYRQCRDKIRSAIIRELDKFCPEAPEISIVPLKKEHAARLAELEKLCFSDPWSEDGIAYEADNPSARFFVAMCGETLAGYAGMMFAADFASVCNIAVFPEYRRKGIGRQLMNALIDTCRELDVAVLSLEVRTSNKAAQALYSQLGFEPVGVRKNFYSSPNEDAVVMNKELL